jgi:hypothetical protein
MVFISCAVTAAAIMYLTFPDTLNKSLEEVEAMFEKDELSTVYQKDIVEREANPDDSDKVARSRLAPQFQSMSDCRETYIFF